MDAEAVPDEQVRTAEEELLVAERHAALRGAFGDLPPGDQQLVLLLIGDPPVPVRPALGHRQQPLSSGALRLAARQRRRTPK